MELEIYNLLIEVLNKEAAECLINSNRCPFLAAGENLCSLSSGLICFNCEYLDRTRTGGEINGNGHYDLKFGCNYEVKV